MKNYFENQAQIAKDMFKTSLTVKVPLFYSLLGMLLPAIYK